MQHTLYLKSTDSRYATEAELNAAQITPDQLPHGWKLMAHQAATIRALLAGDAPIIVNQAMTGDGKSLAGQFMLFSDWKAWPTFTMYPTNELVRDQERSVREKRGQWAALDQIVHRVINAEELDDLQTAQPSLSRMRSLELLLNSELVLTNPDIYHLAMQFAYRYVGAAPTVVLGELAHRFRLFVFDEFHLFGAAQTASVMIALLLAREIASAKRPPRFLFLSATPQEQLAHLAAKAGLKVEHVHGDYCHGEPTPPEGYRRILESCTLHLYGERLEPWVEAHAENIILRFFREHRPGAKGVIIANSVATAYRVFWLLQPLCQEAGIRLAINTGLTPKPARSLDFDLLVATSTIDVGVDFRINLLIFESNDAATHLQRLGRLGRHRDDGQGNSFNHFEAHALLPDWVVESIAARLPAGTHVGRDQYRVVLEQDDGDLKAAFPRLQTFDAYIQKWAGVQSAQVLSQLRSPVIKRTYAETVSRLHETYKALFPGGMRKFITLNNDGHDAILDAARSFRGGSPFSALVLDTSTGQREVVAYNLISLLRNAELEEESIEEMVRRASPNGEGKNALMRSKPLAAYKLLGWLPKPRPIAIYLDRTLSEEQYEVVIEQKGFQLDVPDVPGINALNRRLEARPLAALLIRNREPETLRRLLRLGLQLELFPFTTADGEHGSVAFARDALLLDSILYQNRKAAGSIPIFL